jgi:GNAT superfamily N-acetyltransferase
LTVSFRMFESTNNAPEGIVPLPKIGEAERGTHVVSVDGGFTDTGERPRFVNSWGSGWGDKGTGLLSREYLERYMVDAWHSRNVLVGPSRFHWRRLAGATNDREFARAWMIQNPRWQTKLRHHGRSRKLYLYETLSIPGSPVEVIEVRNGWGQRLGWAHIHHVSSRQPRTSILKEMFVWPWFRRRGYGTLLENLACQRAKARRSMSIEVFSHDADALPRNRAAGRLFGREAGYEWKWRKQRHPNLAAVGKKSL